MLTKLKMKVQSWITSGAKAALKIGLSPNKVSAAGIIFGVASGFAYWASGVAVKTNLDLYRFSLSSAVILLLLSGFCDALDGALARLYGETTSLGGFLDSLLDRYVDASVYCGLILGGLCDPLWGLIALIGSLLTSYTRARSEAAGVPMETIGVAERAERLLIIMIASIINLASPRLEALRWSVVILAVVTNLTVLQRTVFFYRKVGSNRSGKSS